MNDVDKRACAECYPHPAHASGECEYCICVAGPVTINKSDDHEWETSCDKSPDEIHCVHWWDADGPCCYCNDKGATTMMTFGMAIEAMREGKKVSREGWNGKGMWIAIQKPDDGTKLTGPSKMTVPFIFMSTVQRDYIPWLASQADILSTDWGVVEG